VNDIDELLTSIMWTGVFGIDKIKKSTPLIQQMSFEYWKNAKFQPNTEIGIDKLYNNSEQ